MRRTAAKGSRALTFILLVAGLATVGPLAHEGVSKATPDRLRATSARYRIRITGESLPHCRGGNPCDLRAYLVAWTTDRLVTKCAVRPAAGATKHERDFLWDDVVIDGDVERVGVVFELGEHRGQPRSDAVCTPANWTASKQLVEWSAAVRAVRLSDRVAGSVDQQIVDISCDVGKKRCAHAELAELAPARKLASL